MAAGMVPDVEGAALPVGGAADDDEDEYDVGWNAGTVALSRGFEARWGEPPLQCWRVDDEDNDSIGSTVDDVYTGG